MKRLLLIGLTLALLRPLWAADERHDMAKALDLARHLVLLQNLNPDAQDLATMLTTSRSLVRYQSEYDKAHESALTQNLALLQAERNSLATGVALPDATAQALADFRAAEADRYQKLLLAFNVALRQMSRRLAPEVGQRVDWSVPPDVPLPSGDDLRGEQLRLLAARLEETARAIDRIRYLPMDDYATLRVSRLQEFLRDYYRPKTKAFDEALNYMLDLTTEMKRTPEKDYLERRMLFASRALLYLGALGDEPPRQVQADYNWWDMYDLLSDPQMPALLEKIVNRLNAGGGQ